MTKFFYLFFYFMKKNRFLVYNIGMHNKSKRYWKIPVHPDNILEVRLTPDVWAKIVRIAGMKKTTYSWVVRYCVFRLIKRKDPRRNVGDVIFRNNSTKFNRMDSLARGHIASESFHRHKLCLYEEDEFFIRMTAALMHCTMTHLVRLALEWYLDHLDRFSYGRPSRFNKLAFYWLGIKLYGGVALPIFRPENKDLCLIRIEENEYW